MFPTVQGAQNTTSLAATTHAINYPASLAAGELLFCIFATDGDPTITFPAGWTVGINESTGSSAARLAIAYIRATGSESGTFNVTTSDTQGITARVLRIANLQGVEFSAVTVGASTGPNSASLTTSWSGDTLFMSIFGADGGSITVNSYPANMPDNRAASAPFSTDAAAFWGIATDEVAGNTRDPDAYKLSGSEQWVAVTVGVEGPHEIEPAIIPTAEGVYSPTIVPDQSIEPAIIASAEMFFATCEVFFYPPAFAPEELCSR